jgi:uncharacterized membrane protein YfcA
MMGFFTLSAVLALATYALHGMIGLHLLAYFLLALPVLYLGDRLGTWLFTRHGADFYRRAAILVLFALGLLIIARALMSSQ